MRCFARKYGKKVRTFYNLPKSPIPFDKDRIAKLIDSKMFKTAKTPHKGRLYEIARLRLEGYTVSEVRDKLALHQEQYRRDLLKILKWFVGYVDSLEEPSEFASTLENASFEEKSIKSPVT
jgi:beta-lactamase class D